MCMPLHSLPRGFSGRGGFPGKGLSLADRKGFRLRNRRHTACDRRRGNTAACAVIPAKGGKRRVCTTARSGGVPGPKVAPYNSSRPRSGTVRSSAPGRCETDRSRSVSFI